MGQIVGGDGHRRPQRGAEVAHPLLRRTDARGQHRIRRRDGEGRVGLGEVLGIATQQEPIDAGEERLVRKVPEAAR